MANVKIDTEKIPFYGAIWDKTGNHRYALWRIWNTEKNCIAFIGLNPSTANENENDPTVNRCQKFAERWGYGGFYMLNLFSYRATNPKNLPERKLSTKNVRTILAVCKRKNVKDVVVCWGCHGNGYTASMVNTLYRKPKVPAPLCFGKTKEGHPKHPLYLPNDVETKEFSEV